MQCNINIIVIVTIKQGQKALNQDFLKNSLKHLTQQKNCDRIARI